MFGSNFSSNGSNFFTPCFSSTFRSSRSVSSTPSSSALVPASAFSRSSASSAPSARSILSATARISLAKAFHLCERAQELVLVIGGFAGERDHGVLVWGGRRRAGRGMDRCLGRGLIASLIVLIGRGARCANGRIRHVVFPLAVRLAPDIRVEAQKIKPQRPRCGDIMHPTSCTRHHAPMSLLTTLAV